MSEPASAPAIANVIGQDGELRGVPVEHLEGILRSGAYRLATPQETTAYWREQDYGGAGQTIAAGAEGALSALTFGFGPKIETSLGLTTPEAIMGRAEEHPIAHGIGTAVGIAAPLLITGGAAAPAEAGALGLGTAVRGAAELTAPALIARAGRSAAALAAEAGLPGVVGRIAPAAIGAATEGALYGGSAVVEKALLGDPHLTWEKAASEVGLGALFGGALGGGGKALSELLPASLAESMADSLGKTAGNRNLKAAAGPGGSKAIIGRLQKQYGRENLVKIGQEMGELGLVGPLSSPEGTLEAAQALKKSVGAEMEGILASADAVGAGAPKIKDVVARARREVLAPLAENPLEQGTARQVAEFLEGYEAKFSPPAAADALLDATGAAAPPVAAPNFGFKALHEMRRQVSDKLYGLRGTQDPGGTALKEALHDFRTLLSEEIDSGLQKASLSSPAWKAANRKYTVASVAHKLAEDGVLKHVGNNLLSLTEILAGLTGAGTHGFGAGTLAALGTKFAREKASGLLGWAATGAQRRLLALAAKSDKKLSAAAKNLFQSGGSAVGAQLAVQKVEHLASGGVVGQGSFGGVSTHLRELSSNLDGMAETVGRQTDVLQEHAPGTADAARAFAVRVVQHLASKLPESAPQQLLDLPVEPSPSEVAEFGRHHEVAMRGPVALLEHAAKGTLHPDHLEASEALYPRLHAEAQQLVAAQLADHLAAGNKVPISKRGSIGLLLGADLEHASTPSAVLAAQRAFQEPEAPTQPPASSAQGGERSRQVDTKFAGRLATGSERVGSALYKGVR